MKANRKAIGGFWLLVVAALFGRVLSPPLADAATILSTDFTGRTVSGKTAGNIPWITNGVQNPGTLTWAMEGGGPTNTGLFDTPNAQGHFAPDMNIDNEGPWSVTIPLVVTAPQILLEEVVLDWQHFNNSGAFQTAARSADWTVSVAGSVAGALGSVTASNVSGLSGIQTLRFAAALELTPAQTYAVKIFVKGNSIGNNTGLDGLSLNGVISNTEDTNAPAILTLSPADNAGDASPGQNLAITFDEAVRKGAGAIVIRQQQDHAAVETIDVTSARVAISGATVTINPRRNLAGNTGYYVQIAPGALQDLFGNQFAGIIDHSTWNFTVAAAGNPLLAIEFVEDDQDGFDLWPQPLTGLSSSSASFPADPTATSGTILVTLTASTTFGAPANRGSLSDGNPVGFSFSGLYRDLLIAQTPTGYLTLTFSGLNPSQTYRLTLYAWDPAATNTVDKEWTVVEGTGTPPAASLNFLEPLLENDSFAMVFDITTTASGTFHLQNTGGLEQSAINGFTLAKVGSAPFALAIHPAVDGLELAWESRPGNLYNLRASPALTGAASGWPLVEADIPATPPLNTKTVSPSDPSRFFAVEEFPAPPSPAPTQMNVLVLFADDWRYDTLACAGNPIVQTPNLDRLASEGLRFSRAYVTTAICGVSRASLLTGQWMSRHGATGFEMFNTPWSQTFPGLLRSRGYWVGHVGKWHNGAFPAANYNFGRSYSGRHWITNGASAIHVTRKNEEDALEFLRSRPTNQPFCLMVAFFAPHAEDANPLQYLPQPQSTNLYQEAVIPVPSNANDASFYRLPPFLATEQNEGRVRWHWRFDTPDKYQTMMKNYYRLCTEVDAACGRVLAELQQQGELEKTLVLFAGDNGYFHGEHGLADKWYPHQESIRVPLIVRDPRLPLARRGLTNDHIALNVDLAPTILAAAGVGAPATMQGRDLAPLYLEEQKPAWRTEFFYEHAIITSTNRIPASQALVRQDWKYFYWPDFGTEQLFDLSADPLEENDLIDEPSAAARLAEMRTRFAELKAAAQ